MNKLKITIFYTLVLYLFTTSVLYSQKMKYKDINVLLFSKQYTKAEPYLKNYLKENTDNPNAFLYMGIIYQDKVSQIDPLVHTNILNANIDSAHFFLNKAYQTITQKELDKRDEYYSAYLRRDLRSGKVVIKLSDVQLDIDNRINLLKTKKKNVSLLKKYFKKSTDHYRHVDSMYRSLQTDFGNDKILFLRSDEKLINRLHLMSTLFDSCIAAFDTYKPLSQELDNTRHNQTIDLQQIKDFASNGGPEIDFLKNDLKLWDYKRWASESIEVIEKEILPMRKTLITYNDDINNLRKKLVKDSVAVKDDLLKLISKINFQTLKKFDDKPFPLDFFAMKTTELECHSDEIADKFLKDSTNLLLKLNAVQSRVSSLKKLDSLCSLLAKRNLNEDMKNYNYFISQTTGDLSALQSNINDTKKYAEKVLLRREKQREATIQSLKWITTNTADSIPLFTEFKEHLKFKPIVIESEKFTFGLHYKDSTAKGYFYSISPSRTATFKVNFPVNEKFFTKRNFPSYKGLWTVSPSGDTYFVLIYSTLKIAAKFNSSLVKLNQTDGLIWSNSYGFDFLPSEIIFSAEKNELLVKQITPDGTANIITINKQGNLIK